MEVYELDQAGPLFEREQFELIESADDLFPIGAFVATSLDQPPKTLGQVVGHRANLFLRRTKEKSRTGRPFQFIRLGWNLQDIPTPNRGEVSKHQKKEPASVPDAPPNVTKRNLAETWGRDVLIAFVLGFALASALFVIGEWNRCRATQAQRHRLLVYAKSMGIEPVFEGSSFWRVIGPRC